MCLDRESYDYIRDTYAYLFEEDTAKPNLFINKAINFNENKITIALDLLPEDLFYENDEEFVMSCEDKEAE